MTLGRQLASAISAIFFVALVGVQAIHLRGAQAHLQQQLESLAQDAATSLGLSLGSLLGGGDPALAETVVNPVFDRGHYEKIEYVSATGERLVNRHLPLREGEYPAWFVELFPLHAPTAESLVSAGWRQAGRVRVTVHPRFAYEQLWATARDTALYLLLIYVAAMLALRLFLRGVLRPLAAVESAALAISARDFVTVPAQPATRELARVVDAMNTLSRRVRDAMEAERRRAERLQADAYHDAVSGLLNARGFAARFESVYEGEHEPLAGVLALLEIAELAAINREIGAERCDELLRALLRPLEEDAAQAGGFAGRWSGARAIVALPRLRGEAAREKLAALRGRALLALREAGLERYERVYCGGSESADGHATLHALAGSAEEALLRARETAEGVMVLEAAAAPLEAEAVVREALGAGRVRLVGQIAYRMSDHRPIHTEIMARLADPAGTDLAAARFMPIIAAHGLDETLDRAVIERVVREARRGDAAVSVNVSMRSLERPGFAPWLAQLLARERALAPRLAFEIAEHGVLRNPAAAAEFAAAVSRAGAVFAIDHFGIHRDSVALLQRLRPAYVKLAGTHTPRLAADAGARFLAESLLQAARQLDIAVIAQQVEDDATFQSIGALGFAGYQGNLGGRPVPWPAAGA